MKTLKLWTLTLLVWVSVLTTTMCFRTSVRAQTPPLHEAITAVAWSRDEAQYTTGHFDGSVRVWDTNTGALQVSLVGNNIGCVALAWSPNQRYLASSGYDSVEVWDVQTETLVSSIPTGEFDPVNSLVWTVDSNFLMGGSAGVSSFPTFSIWDIRTGQSTYASREFGAISHLGLNPDGSTILIGQYTGDIVQFDIISLQHLISSRQPAHSDPNTSADAIWSSTLSVDGRYAATGHQNGIIRIWDLASSDNAIPMLRGYPASSSQSGNDNDRTVLALVFGEDGQSISSISANGTVRTIELATGAILRETQVPFPVYAAAWSPSGSAYITGGVGSTPQFESAPSVSSLYSS